MKERINKKTVQSEVERKSWFSRIKEVFYDRNQNHDPVAKRKYNLATDEQIRKIFRLRRENPKLSQSDIAKAVGLSEAVIHYYFSKNEKSVFAKIKLKKTKSKVEIKPKQKTPQTEFTLSNSEAESNLNRLYENEKYPVEHQADPRYFNPTLPKQAVATDEAFQDQKRRNNINRVNTAKFLIAKVESKKEEKRKERLRKKHQDPTNPMKIHLEKICPSCNPKSTLSVDDYNVIVYEEFKRQRAFAMKQQGLIEREKELDQLAKESLGNVAERAKEGIKLCSKCDKPITYSQESRCKGRYGIGQFYCKDHEPERGLGR